MLIRQGTLMVQEAAVSLVSTVAETGQEGFGRFYDVVMPFLMQVRSRRVLPFPPATHCVFSIENMG